MALFLCLILLGCGLNAAAKTTPANETGKTATALRLNTQYPTTPLLNGTADGYELKALLVGGAMDKKTADNVMVEFKKMQPVFKKYRWNVIVSAVSRHESNESLFECVATVNKEIKAIKPQIVIGYSGGGPVALSATYNDTNSSVLAIVLLDSTNGGIPKLASQYVLKLDPSWPSVDQWVNHSAFMNTSKVNVARYKYIQFDSAESGDLNNQAAMFHLGAIFTDLAGIPKMNLPTTHAGLLSDPIMVGREINATQALLNQTKLSSQTQSN